MERDFSVRIDSDWESGLGTLVVDFNTVPGASQQYLPRIDFVEDRLHEHDYLPITKGQVSLRQNSPKSQNVFDLNKVGEMIIIGEDAFNYYLDNRGHLIYRYEE